MLEFFVLGPLEVRRDGELVPVPGGRQRALLALLLAEYDRTVAADRAIAHLWDGRELPVDPANALQQCVAKLRRALAGRSSDGVAHPLILTRGGGYALMLGASRLDSVVFERMTSEAGPLVARDPARAVELLRAGAALWRGRPFGHLGESEFLEGEAARLTELYMIAVEDRGEAELALGRERTVSAEFAALVRRHPFRERLWAHLMLALYRSGRQTEALETFHRARRRFRDELGIEPGPALRDLERRILVHDQGLLRSGAGQSRAPRAWSVYPLLDAVATFTSAVEHHLPRARLDLLLAITEAAGAEPSVVDLERWSATLAGIDAAIDAALHWSFDEAPGLGLRLAVAACLWWDWRGSGPREAGILERLLGAAPAATAARAEALTWLAFFQHELGDRARAERAIVEADRVARLVRDPVRVGGAAAVASILARETSPSAAVAHADEAVRLLSTYGNSRERGYALVCRALALVAAGQFELAAGPANEAAVTYAEAGDLRGEAWVSGIRAAIAGSRGDRAESTRLRREAREFAEALDDEATRRWMARFGS